MLWVLNVVVVVLLVAVTAAVVVVKDLIAASIILSGQGLLMGVLWTRLNSPDLALIYVGLCVCITTLMLVISIQKTTRRED